MKKRFFAVIFAFMMLFSLTSCGSKKSEEKINWSDLYLGSILPETNMSNGKVIFNENERLTLYLHDVSKSDYDNYVSQCKDKGFSVDAEQNPYGFFAYNTDGYKLNISMYESLKQIHIELNAPIELLEIEWPSGKAGKQVPVPESLKGNIFYDRDDSFRLYIGNTSKETFGKYIKTCSEAGFNIDYDKSDIKYTAKNNLGYKLNLSYEGNNIMEIEVEAPDDADTVIAEIETTEAETEAITDNEIETSADDDPAFGVNPEFKATLDAYEAFFDEYIAFMEKYKNADQSELMNMLNDYNDYLKRYAEAVTSLNEIDSNSLSPADLAYYTEVMLRLSQKLAAIN